jgi:hypothetical protein
MTEQPAKIPPDHPPPPWLRIAAGLFYLILFGFVLGTFHDYGISWDEEVQNTYGNMILSFYRSGFHDRSAMHYLNLFYYGGFFDLIAAIANLVSPFGVYVTRHLLGGIFLLVGLAGAWRLVRLLAGERAALIAILMLTFNPVLYGHSFINPKDAPLAWLFLWVIYYACRAIEEGRPKVTTIVWFGVVAGLAFGTRVLAAPLLVYILIALGVGGLMNMWRPEYGTNPFGRMTLRLLAAAPLAYVVMGIFWPWAVIDPFNPLLAIHEFTNFPWKGWLLFDGQMMPAINLPRDYLLTFLLYQLPEHTLIGMVLAVISAGVVCARRGVPLLADRKTLQYLILIQAAVVPIIAFVVLRPTVYNGMRHFLFVVPPLVILAAIGWDKLLAAVTARRPGPRFALGGILAVLLLWQLLRMVDLHPYEYVAYNRLAGGIAGASGRFELDYWDTSLAEASRKLTVYLKKHPKPAPPVIFVCGNRLSASAFLPKDVRLTWKIEEADYFISIVPSACRDHVDVTKNRLIEVRRDHITLSYVIDLDAARPKTDNTRPGS